MIWKNDRPGDAGMAGKGALVSVIINVVLFIPMDRVRGRPIRHIRLLLKDGGGMAGPWKSERGGAFREDGKRHPLLGWKGGNQLQGT